MSKVVKPDLSTAVRSVKLICVNVQRNNNKQWAAWVLSNGDLYSENGRVGYTQAAHLKSFGAVNAAEKALSKLIAEKRAKGYEFVSVEEQPPAGLNFSELGEEYAAQIQQQFSHLSAQSELITRHTAIQFDQNQGLFVTQMGIISSQTVARAITALRQIEAALQSRSQQSNDNQHYIEAVESYLATIPLQVGMRLDPQQILGNTAQVRQQFAVLNRLSECLDQIQSIRSLIEQAISSEHSTQADVGSDERARWLSWGAIAETNDNSQHLNAREAGENRAQWVRW